MRSSRRIAVDLRDANGWGECRAGHPLPTVSGGLTAIYRVAWHTVQDAVNLLRREGRRLPTASRTTLCLAGSTEAVKDLVISGDHELLDELLNHADIRSPSGRASDR